MCYGEPFAISSGPEASEARTADGTGSREGQPATESGGGGKSMQDPSARPTRAAAETGTSGTVQAGIPKWKGPKVGDNRWGGQAWRKHRDDPTCVANGVIGSPGDEGGATGASSCTPSSSWRAKEQAAKLLEQRANLLAAQTREREAAEAAKMQAAEALRLQQAQQEQQRQAMADAAAAADARRQAQQAMAEAEAQEAARQEMERQALVARTSPEELRRVQELHAQQTAIAAAGFGTAQAVAGAGLLQATVPCTQLQDDGGMDDDAARIMDMSPEELAEQQRGSMDVGSCPW